MDTLFGNISTKQFLADYWQKKPLFVADAFDPAEQDFEADDLAGLACEAYAQSPLVHGNVDKRD